MAGIISEEGLEISSLQAIVAHLWRSIIRCRFDRESAAQETTTFELSIGARQRLIENPPLLEQSYFGNAVFPGIVTLEPEKMLENGLGWTAWQINRVVASFDGPDKVKEFYMGWIKKPSNDFGWGKPVGVRSGGANSSDGRVSISGGLEEGSVEIEACLFLDTLSKLGEDKEFMEF
ncbi:uncharacterized acetyltransferase at3g50280 [Phtheirospermum japonicum]|uniref:Uncharacterized acetyltransferase at3g50280 n=1 Tax=Phtheirospermum japonicum TaxID=374723 RepID=A0A830CF49_9LAMI|nr:uncharacterized acetyltransferase at3g50280 [Phtheirospermum japonicum]